MKKSRYNEEQIIGFLKQAENLAGRMADTGRDVINACLGQVESIVAMMRMGDLHCRQIKVQ